MLTGANFQGSPASMPIDPMGGAITMACVLSERPLNRLTNPAKTRQIVDTAYGVLGIELMGAAQALDFRSYGFGKGTRAAHAVIRQHVEFLDVDRPLYPDHNAMAALVKSGEILEAVEAVVGELAAY